MTTQQTYHLNRNGKAVTQAALSKAANRIESALISGKRSSLLRALTVCRSENRILPFGDSDVVFRSEADITSFIDDLRNGNVVETNKHDAWNNTYHWSLNVSFDTRQRFEAAGYKLDEWRRWIRAERNSEATQ